MRAARSHGTKEDRCHRSSRFALGADWSRTPARDCAIATLEIDLDYLLIVELMPATTSRARSLLLRHALRAGDAIQLASCLYLQEEVGHQVPFVAFDRRVRRAARLEGLSVAPTR